MQKPVTAPPGRLKKMPVLQHFFSGHYREQTGNLRAKKPEVPDLKQFLTFQRLRIANIARRNMAVLLQQGRQIIHPPLMEKEIDMVLSEEQTLPQLVTLEIKKMKTLLAILMLMKKPIRKSFKRASV